ncbi:MAG: hypothetical protein ABSH34_17980 [Verrucomicrobiota bacterium]|jgi:hypothetical protein
MLRSFFQNNQFRTVYATHGLLPYLGKFRPQMAKGLLNAMGLKSIGLDASPFCRFMAQVMAECARVLRPGRFCAVIARIWGVALGWHE